jgi:hypothetical protein
MLTGVVIAESPHSDVQPDAKVVNIARITRVVVEARGRRAAAGLNAA